MALVQLTDSNFKKEVLESKVLVVVDFWAPWCGPCKAIAPLLEELAKHYDGKVKIAKLNVDENPKTTTAYGIMSIPTLVFFKHGKISEQAAGALNKAGLKEKIEAGL